MITAVVTGADGFLGRNLVEHLSRLDEVRVQEIRRETVGDVRRDVLKSADIVFHLAGVNRPVDVEDFDRGNREVTEALCQDLLAIGRATPIIFSSSIQAELDNPYGISKRASEDVLQRYVDASGASATVLRLHNVFGKWSRPNYNSVVSTFCYNISHDLPIAIADPDRVIELVYVDNVIRFMLGLMSPQVPGSRTMSVDPIHRVTLGELADRIRTFRDNRRTLHLPDFSEPFQRYLYATYVSYLAPNDFAYDLTIHADARGSLAEFVKSPAIGQLFVSRTNPGVTRGNHFHDTKVEKFLVVEGEGLVRFRLVDGTEILEYPVRGDQYRVVDIPVGYTHSITNVGTGELVVLFWANEIFDPAAPDTYFMGVEHAQA